MAQTAPSLVSNINSQVSTFLESLPYPEAIKLVGVIALIILPIILLYAAIRLFNVFSGRIQRVAAMRAMHRDTTPGNKILIASIRGASGGAARSKVMEAMEQHLPDFNFNSPFYMGAAPVSIEATDFALSRADFATLKATFEASGADLIIWGDTQHASKATRLCFATPQTIKGNQSGGFFTMDLTGNPRNWSDEEYMAMAYVAGKRLRPSLGRPSDFRADRLEPILLSMSKVLESGDVITGAARTELEDDYAAGALHVGQSLKSAEWLQKSVDFRTSALETMQRGSDPIRWAQAKIDLGRAMCGLCEQKFEPAMLQNAMTHIREGIDSTKSDQRMQLAETGFEALQRAEQMLADRRRFSIRWSV